jgi:transcriptional regulator with XRE-family HTH domain
VQAAHDAAADADPHGVRVGAQLRAARRAARKTIAEVADEAGLTKGFISKLERDRANVSVASLMRLCDALGVPIGSMFQASKGEIVRLGDYPPIDFGGSGMREYLLTPSGEKRVQAILSEIQPGGGSGDEPYSLPAEVEFAFVLAGRLHITIDGEAVTLDQGDAFTFPAGAPHAFRSVEADGATRVLWLVAPALPDNGWQRPAGPDRAG